MFDAIKVAWDEGLDFIVSDFFFSMLDGSLKDKEIADYIASLRFENLKAIHVIASHYWLKGGLPKAYLAKNLTQAFAHIQAAVERGFAPILQDTLDIFDLVTVELARTSAREKLFSAHTNQKPRQDQSSYCEVGGSWLSVRKAPLYSRRESLVLCGL